MNEKGSTDEHKRLSHVPEEEEDDVGITIKVITQVTVETDIEIFIWKSRIKE